MIRNDRKILFGFLITSFLLLLPSLIQAADTTPPTGTMTITPVTRIQSAGITNNISDAGSNMVGAQMQFCNDSAANPCTDPALGVWSDKVSYAASKNWPLSAGYGAKKVYGRFFDASNNSITLSATTTWFSLNVNVKGGYAGQTIPITWTSAGIGPTVDIQLMDYKSNKVVKTLATGLATANGLYNWISTKKDSDYDTVYRYRVIDSTNALLMGTTGKVELYKDTTPPTITSFTINNGAKTLNNTNRYVGLKVPATDSQSGMGTGAQIKFCNDSTEKPCTNDALGVWSAPQPYVASSSKTWPWQLSEGDGMKTVYVKVMDAGENWSAASPGTIRLDTVPPTVNSFTINGGAPMTNNPIVQLVIDAIDAGSGMGPGAMMNFKLFSKGEPFATSKTFTLPSGDGLKTVMGWFSDAAGNWLGMNSFARATIVLDTTPPTVAITANRSGGSTVLITATAADANGLQKVEFYRDVTTLLGTAASSPYQFSWNTTGVALGAHTLTAKAFDIAGNSTTSAAVNITLAQPPVTTSSGIDNLPHHSPVTVTLSATGPTPIANTYYSTDGSTPSLVYTAPITLFIDGTYAIKYYSIDAAGNAEDVQTAANQVRINTTTLPGAITLADYNAQMGRDADAPGPSMATFIRGDANGDGVVNAADLQILTNYLNGNHSLLSSYDIGDINGDGTITQADRDYLSSYVAGTGLAPALPFPTQAVIHPYYCAASPCLAVLNNRVVKFVVYYASTVPNHAQWRGVATDPATSVELAHYVLEAQYGDAATESTFSVTYSRADDTAANKSGIPETTASFTKPTHFHDNGSGQQVRDEIDANTAITLLADLLNVEAGPMPAQAAPLLSPQTAGSAVSKTAAVLPTQTVGTFTSVGFPPPGQPGGGNQQFPRCPNGCSGPVNLPFKTSQAMHSCCDNHDLCYADGGDPISKMMCDDGLRECLRWATPAWQTIIGHLAPPFVTKEIAQWFRENFADAAFRWTNEQLTCGWTADGQINGWPCFDHLVRLPTMSKGCSLSDQTCTIHKGAVPGMPAEDRNYSCRYRSYMEDW